MKRLSFTTGVLRKKAAGRLRNKQVTQSIRSTKLLMLSGILNGSGSPVGDEIEIILDGQVLGIAEIQAVDETQWSQIELGDAKRGGFDSRFELAYALRRAGFRFKDLEEYNLYRVLFSWL